VTTINTHTLARGLQACLQVLQGDYSTGSVTATATGDPVELPKGTFGLPIIDGSEDESQALLVEANPSAEGGAWTATSTGTPVSVTSIQGGTHVNLDADTPVRWDPPIAGLASTGVVAAGGLTGGAQATHYGALRQVRYYRDMGANPGALDFFAAGLHSYPAAVIGWESTTPADGAALPGVGPDSTRRGQGKREFVATFGLMLFTGRFDQTHQRRKESDQLRDDVLELLTDRVSYRGCYLSSSAGIQILEARHLGSKPSHYVDVVRIACHLILSRRDDRTFHDWLTTRLQLATVDVTV
jgi:hypothetical protein